MAFLGGKGNVGVGAGYAAFLLIKGLLNHLVRTGALDKSDRDAIIDEAIAEVPAMSNTNYEDTKDLLNGAKE